MPFYLIEQKGMPGARLVEAEKPATALNYVIGDSFTAKKIDGRDLLEAAKKYDPEVAGAIPTPSPAPAEEEEEEQRGEDEESNPSVND